jgi:aminocarboxymuconate-semialdehyde decarboxylase
MITHSCGAPSHRGPCAIAVRPGAVDVHSHIVNPDVEKLVQGRPERESELAAQLLAMGPESLHINRELTRTTYLPRLTSLEHRLADMDAVGISVQVLSPTPLQYHYWADAELGSEIARVQNEGIAAACARVPSRFVGLGTVSLQFPESAASQLEHAVTQLGLRGVQISSRVPGFDISDERFEPFWSAAEALEAVVFLHPSGTTLGDRLRDHYLSNVIGQPLESTIALTKIILTGLLDRHPSLKLLAAHGAGYLGAYFGRLDHAHLVRPEASGCTSAPSDYLRRIWADTVVHDSRQITALIALMGHERLVLGTDYPYDMGEQDPVALIEELNLGADEQEAILWLNAHRLFNIVHPSIK